MLRDSAHKLTLSDHNPRLSPKTRHKKYKRQSHVINYHTLHDGPRAATVLHTTRHNQTRAGRCVQLHSRNQTAQKERVWERRGGCHQSWHLAGGNGGRRNASGVSGISPLHSAFPGLWLFTIHIVHINNNTITFHPCQRHWTLITHTELIQNLDTNLSVTLNLNLRYNQPIHYNNKALSLPSYEFNSYFWVGYSKSKMAHGRGKGD